MIELAQRVEQNIIERRLLRRGQAVLVAVSGGLDSMVLLHLLAELSAKHGWRLTVAHFNHQLRGRRSDLDEKLVVRTAQRLGLPCVTDRADVRKHAALKKLSLEMAARGLRHAFLASAAHSFAIRTIALAHHADDQVELFFLRLLRGAGSAGLAGMKWRNASPADSKKMLIRPMLDQTKEDYLQDFARAHKIIHQDATNARVDVQRNRVRHELLPLLLKHYQPALKQVILRQMDLIEAEADFLKTAAAEWLKAKQPQPFASLAAAVQRQILHLQLAAAGVTANFDLIERLRLCPDEPSSVAKELTASRSHAGRIQLSRNENPAFSSSQIALKFNGNKGAVTFDGVEMKWGLKTASGGTFRALQGSGQQFEQFDAAKVGLAVVLRHWRPGDRFQPIGMESAVKLQDLFTNQKIPRTERHRSIVGVTRGGELFWVEGLRLGERFKLDKQTRRVLQWAWKRL